MWAGVFVLSFSISLWGWNEARLSIIEKSLLSNSFQKLCAEYIFCGFYFYFLIFSTKYTKSHVLQFWTLRIFAKVYLNQKIFPSEEVITTSLDSQPLCCQNIFYKQFISEYKLKINNSNISRNTQALGHNPIHHPSPMVKGWHIAPIATSINRSSTL